MQGFWISTACERSAFRRSRRAGRHSRLQLGDKRREGDDLHLQSLSGSFHGRCPGSRLRSGDRTPFTRTPQKRSTPPNPLRLTAATDPRPTTTSRPTTVNSQTSPTYRQHRTGFSRAPLSTSLSMGPMAARCGQRVRRFLIHGAVTSSLFRTVDMSCSATGNPTPDQVLAAAEVNDGEFPWAIPADPGTARRLLDSRGQDRCSRLQQPSFRDHGANHRLLCQRYRTRERVIGRPPPAVTPTEGSLRRRRRPPFAAFGYLRSRRWGRHPC